MFALSTPHGHALWSRENKHHSLVALSAELNCGGGERIRTDDLLRAKQALSQLSYTPLSPAGCSFRVLRVVGLDGLEPSTSRLSGVRSNQLSYRPIVHFRRHTHFHPLSKIKIDICFDPSKLNSDETDRLTILLLRKEVIQPQVPLRLPCYDFTPITDHTLGACFPCGLAQRLLVQPAFVV
jgi:hypothetical protein